MGDILFFKFRKLLFGYREEFDSVKFFSERRYVDSCNRCFNVTQYWDLSQRIYIKQSVAQIPKYWVTLHNVIHIAWKNII
jgi:hypothetical protein